VNLLCIGRGRGLVVNLRENLKPDLDLHLDLYLGLHLGINVDVGVGIDVVVCGCVDNEVCSRGQAVLEDWPAAGIHGLGRVSQREDPPPNHVRSQSHRKCVVLLRTITGSARRLSV
jgi:hypothetical protein